MAVKKQLSDQYANIAYLKHTQIGVATLEFSRLDIVSGALLGDKKFGLLLQRAEFYTKAFDAMTDFALEDDYFLYGLCVTDSLADVGLQHPEVLCQLKFGNYLRQSPGGAVNDIVSFPAIEPIVLDFSAFGGILVPADRLWLYQDTSNSAGAAAGNVLECRLFYTTLELSTEQYWELIEARRIITT